MSAAVKSEPSEPHRRLGAPVNVPRDRLLGRAGIPPVAPVPIRLVAWGMTGADVERAVFRAGLGKGRAGWQFQVEETREIPCPLNLEDPKALAAEGGYHWAYVAYPADGADG